MARHRWTIQELDTMSDAEIVRRLVRERLDDATNPYAPLTIRLTKIAERIDRMLSEYQYKV
jgi:hypothetical protein